LPKFVSGSSTPRRGSGSLAQPAGAKWLDLLGYYQPGSAPEPPLGVSFLSNGPDPADPPPRSAGPLRGFLRLIVEVDESRRWTHRVRAALLLMLLLVGFGLVGYWVPEILERHLR
jgi:hypothetical protein